MIFLLTGLEKNESNQILISKPIKLQKLYSVFNLKKKSQRRMKTGFTSLQVFVVDFEEKRQVYSWTTDMFILNLNK